MCDGTVYNKSDYEDLWAILPSNFKDTTNNTFTIDLRNRGIMGAGTNGALGELQGDTFKRHQHKVYIYDPKHKHPCDGWNPVGVAAAVGTSAVPLYMPKSTDTTSKATGIKCNSSSPTSSTISGDDKTAFAGATTDTETRMKNVRLNWIIKW